ncbi:MAG: hypothetical protein GEU78_19330, partial [Actinobacteria bacterium]|nr:hypothetical protein [Actinomycetota bacterium]
CRQSVEGRLKIHDGRDILCPDSPAEIRLRRQEPLHARLCEQPSQRRSSLVSRQYARVRLHLQRIRVVEVLVDLPERLEVLVRDLRPVVRCPFCAFKTTKVHETRRVRVKDVPRGRQHVTLVWLRRRFECANCGERHTENHPAIEGKLTGRLARAIVKDAQQLSISEISRRYGLSWSTIMALVKAWSARAGERRRKRRCRVLLVDETSLRRRHRYVTVVSNAETGELLGGVPPIRQTRLTMPLPRS